MLSSKLSPRKGEKDNAKRYDESCNQLTLNCAQSVAVLACGRCRSARDGHSWASTRAKRRHRCLRRLSDKIRYLRDVEDAGGAARDLQGTARPDAHGVA